MLSLGNLANKSAASRILAIDTRQIDRVSELPQLPHVILVVFKKGQGLRPRFVSKAAFLQDAESLREMGALNARVEENCGGAFLNVLSQGGNLWHNVKNFADGEFFCDCPDAQHQRLVECKHVKAARNHLAMKEAIAPQRELVTA